MHSRVLSPSPIPSSHSGYILEPITVDTDVNPNPASQILPLFHALYSSPILIWKPWRLLGTQTAANSIPFTEHMLGIWP